MAVAGVGLIIGAAIFYRYATKSEHNEKDVIRKLLKQQNLF
jgi:hypothetical protein